MVAARQHALEQLARTLALILFPVSGQYLYLVGGDTTAGTYGAGKFVKGDAVAGILILFINIIGGFVIGVAQHDLSAAQAASTYILLAVGDALVAQIPGLLISVSAAMVVSRVGKDQDLGRQIADQMFVSPRALGINRDGGFADSYSGP